MKRTFVLLLIAILGYTSESQGQRLTDDSEKMMSLLPRTADDFQSKYYDLDLISAVSISMLNFPLFEDIPITAHNGNITGLTFQIFRTVEKFGEKMLKETPEQGIKMDFTSSGKLINCMGIDGRNPNPISNRFSLFSCIPSSTRLESGIGLADSNGMTVEYTKDTQNRVTEAQVLKSGDPRLIFRYSYLGNTKKISTIKAYNSIGVLIGEVFYNYDNDKLSELYYKTYIKTPTMNALEGEFRKQYTYDAHGNYSKIDFWHWTGSSSSWMREVLTYENQYNPQGQLTISRVGSSKEFNSPSGRVPIPSYSNRKYTYDSMGNWVKIEIDDGIVLKREFQHIGSTSTSPNDPNRIYAEDEVSIRASFGQTVYQHVRKNGIRSLYPYDEEFDRITVKTTSPVNVSFIVEKDGSLSNIRVFNQSDASRIIIYQATQFVRSLEWMPASVNGMPVRSEVSMAWHLNDSGTLVIEKDVTVTNAELTAYSQFAKKQQFERTKKEALSGSVEAKKKLARMYLEGNGTERNETLALEQYVDLAINGDSESENYVLSHISSVSSNNQLVKKIAKSYKGLKNNLLVPSDRWAYQVCLITMNDGNSEARFEYAIRCVYGYGRAKDVDEGTEILEDMANQGSVSAMSALGDVYYERIDYNKSVYWAQKAADKGNVSALILMGKAYENGQGVKKDMKLSFEMYKKAANQGSQIALAEVVYRLISGSGVKKDKEQAEVYFNKLSVDNQGIVANNVFWGKGTKKNKKMGLQLFAVAANNGNEKAREEFLLWSK